MQIYKTKIMAKDEPVNGLTKVRRAFIAPKYYKAIE